MPGFHETHRSCRLHSTHSGQVEAGHARPPLPRRGGAATIGQLGLLTTLLVPLCGPASVANALPGPVPAHFPAGTDPSRTAGSLRREEIAQHASPEAKYGIPAEAQMPPAIGTSGRKSFGDLPIAVNAPPPSWVKPGLRMTFYQMSGNLPAGEWQYKLDENGTWVDRTGAKYTREKVVGGGSHGLLQANIASLSQGKAAVQMIFYLFDGMNLAEPIQKLELGYVAPASTCGDLWMSPDALRQLLATSTPGLRISRVSKKIDNAIYDGVMIYAESPGGRSVWIYDSASGVLIYSSQITKMAPEASHTGARTSQGGSYVRFTTFKASRYPTLPWREQPVPAWLGKVKQIGYEGQFCVRQPGIPDTPIPFNVQLDVADRGTDWVLFNASAGSQVPQGIPGLSTRMSGRGQLGGLWMPVQGLAALRTGQELDRDPLTRVVTSVGRRDAETVTITQTAPRQQLEFTYRLSDGVLVAGVFTERLPYPPGMANVLQLRLVGMQ